MQDNDGQEAADSQTNPPAYPCVDLYMLLSFTPTIAKVRRERWTSNLDKPMQQGVGVTAAFLEIRSSAQHHSYFVGVAFQTADVQRAVSSAVDVVDVVRAMSAADAGAAVEHVHHRSQCRRVRHRGGHVQRRQSGVVAYLRIERAQLVDHIGAARRPKLFHKTSHVVIRCLEKIKPISFPQIIRVKIYITINWALR